MTGLREQNKAKRRSAICDAALLLLRESTWPEVTTERVAALAEVSPATVYNLFGTREQVLVALVQRVIDGVAVELIERDWPTDGDPLLMVRRVVDDSVAAFVAESAAFRRVIAALGATASSGSPLDVDAAQLQVAGMREAQRAGIIDARFPAESLGRQVFLSYLGALQAWAVGALDDYGFRDTARQGLVFVLAASATPEHRRVLADELAELAAQVARASWRQSSDSSGGGTPT